MDVILFNPPRYSNGLHPKFNNALMWLASYLRKRDIDVRVVPLIDEHFAKQANSEAMADGEGLLAAMDEADFTLLDSFHYALKNRICVRMTRTQHDYALCLLSRLSNEFFAILGIQSFISVEQNPQTFFMKKPL